MCHFRVRNVRRFLLQKLHFLFLTFVIQIYLYKKFELPIKKENPTLIFGSEWGFVLCNSFNLLYDEERLWF